MITLARIELRKLSTTPAVYVSLALTAALTVASVLSAILLAGRPGMPPLGSPANVGKALSVAALASMVMLVLGILATAGEYRHRTIVTTFLAEANRGRIVLAKLSVLGGVGVVVGTLTFGVALGVAAPMYAARGVPHLPVDVAGMWLGAALSGGCYALLGVALGALTRNTVGAVIGALAWVQLVEVGLLQNAWPAMAKWLPTGAAVAVTGPGAPTSLLSPRVAALVLAGWAIAVAAIATRVSLRRDVH
jgi:ABC-type transport system involved in multi-copper enzyme maturation permease subunit